MEIILKSVAFLDFTPCGAWVPERATRRTSTKKVKVFIVTSVKTSNLALN
jgi:hypothetical protein